jgi:hypothetical protein
MFGWLQDRSVGLHWCARVWRCGLAEGSSGDHPLGVSPSAVFILAPCLWMLALWSMVLSSLQRA